ncbi:MAG: TrbG/VirB9 family P-type conjugative transfer protein [bacterium]
MSARERTAEAIATFATYFASHVAIVSAALVAVLAWPGIAATRVEAQAVVLGQREGVGHMAKNGAPELKVSRALADTTGGKRDAIVDATREYQRSGIARVIEEGSALVFPFGHSQPTVTCARLRACVIELELGEIVLDKITGDAVRWDIAPAFAGPEGKTTLVVVKPKDCDLTTNLVLSTDRRIYDLTLDSPPCKANGGSATTNPRDAYSRRVRFYYPDDLVARWSKPVTPPAPVAPVIATAPGIESLDFAYRVQKDKEFPWSPAQIFDDGARVYLKLPDSARHGESPVLFVVGDDGIRSILNYAIANDLYVTDRLFRRAVLVTGVGGAERRVTIEYTGHALGGR